MSTETSTAVAMQDPANLAMTAKAREAMALSKSDLVPEQYRGNPANVMIAMELASRINASVIAVMQSLYIIHGKPSFSSSFLIGCVNSCGRFTPMRFRFDGEGDDYGCRAVAKEIESGEECVGVKVTRRMVNAEGWSKKSGSKWLTMDELMYTYRAATFWTRVYAPEISLGMRTTDEYEDIAQQQTTATTIPYEGDRPASRPVRLQQIVGVQPTADEPKETEIVNGDNDQPIDGVF
jgi:hypothetical protein